MTKQICISMPDKFRKDLFDRAKNEGIKYLKLMKCLNRCIIVIDAGVVI